MRPLSVYTKYAHYLRRFATPAKMANMLLNRYELSQGKVLMKSRPFKVTIDPGSFCNLRCPGCHTGIRHPEMIPASFMQLGDYIRIFEQVKKYVMSVALYNWGEPFLNRQIFDMIAHTSAHRVGTTVHSNFNHFSEGMAEDAVRSGLTHIYLSIDGASQEAYEQYRVKGNLDRVLGNLEILLQTRKRMGSKYPLVTWKFLQFEHNLHETAIAAGKARDMGVDAFESFRAYPKLTDIYDQAEDYKKNPVELKEKRCGSLWSSLYVHSDGSVLPCSLAFREPDVFGNLLQHSLDEVWNNASFTSARKMFSENIREEEVPLPCRGCKFYISRSCSIAR